MTTYHWIWLLGMPVCYILSYTWDLATVILWVERNYPDQDHPWELVMDNWDSQCLFWDSSRVIGCFLMFGPLWPIMVVLSIGVVTIEMAPVILNYVGKKFYQLIRYLAKSRKEVK